MADGNANVILLVEDEVIIAMSTKAQLEQYGYVVKNSSIAVLDASIKMAFKLFAAKRALTAGEQRRRLLHDERSTSRMTETGPYRSAEGKNRDEPARNEACELDRAP
jgi:hypothetical protein